MLLVAQHFRITFVVLFSIVGKRKRSFGSTPSMCLSNCYPSFFRRTSLYFPQVVYYSVYTKLGSDWGITTFLVENCFELVDKPEPTAVEHNSKQEGSSVVLTTVRWNSLCDASVSIPCVDCHPKFNTCNLPRHRNQLPQRVVISCRFVERVDMMINL
jgi:hypothetical protein